MALGRREMARGAINRNPQERASISLWPTPGQKGVEMWKSWHCGLRMGVPLA